MRGSLDFIGSEIIAFPLTALLNAANDGRFRIARFLADDDIAAAVEASTSNGVAII